MELIIQTQGVKTLVVDDSQPNLLIAKGVLERYGIAVTTAQSGSEALELIKEQDFDLIILDCIMPQMDGHETAVKIRELPGKKAKASIVAYTSNDEAEVWAEFEDVGITDVLTKPMDIVKLSKIFLKTLPADKMIDEDEVARLLSISGDLQAEELQSGDSKLKQALGVVPELNYEVGLRFVGGSDEAYLNVLKATCKTMGEAMLRLQAYYDAKKGNGTGRNPDGTDPVRDYGCNGVRIDTHSLKGICAGIGLEAFSKDSAVMERMATEGNEIALLGDLYPYIMQLQMVYEALSTAISELVREAEFDDEEVLPMEEAAYRSLWQETEESIEMFDIDAIQEGLKRLHLATTAGEKRNALKEAMEAAEVFEYSAVADILKKYRE